MECNKDEAIRALSIAECRLESKDLAAAKRFALKAQALYPGLGEISQMLTTLNVLVVGENKKITGEVDWYSVLSVNPSADDETIRKQYRKLALLIHPDKNKSVGADGAFKLILEAWSLLSDKGKRLAYNQRRGFQHGGRSHTNGPSAPPPPPRTNAGDNFTSRTTSVPKPTTHNSSAKVPTSSTPTPPANGPSAPPPPPRTNGVDNSASKTTSVPKPKTHNSSAKVPTSSTPTPPTNGPSAPPPPPRTNGVNNSASKTTSVPKPKTHNSSAKVPTSSTPTPPTNGPSAPPPPPRTNGVNNSASKTTSVPKPKTHNSSAKVPTSSTPTPTKRDGCKQGFKASETTPPININKSTNQVPRQQQQAPNPTHVPGTAKIPEPAEKPRRAQKTRPVRNSGPSQKSESAKKPRPTQKPGPASGGVGSVPSPNFQKKLLSGKTNVANDLDSGKSVGVDAAFKLISEAWSLLMAYKKEKSSSGFQHKVSSHTADPSAPPPAKTNQIPRKQHQAPNSGPSQNFEKVPLSDKTNVDSNLDAFTAAKASNVIHDKLKRMHTESKPSASSLEEHMKRRKLDKDSYRQGKNHNMAQGNVVSGHGSGVYGSSGTKRESSSTTRDSGARDRPKY